MDTFCVLPWYSREISGKKHVACCLLPDNHNIELIKIDLLNVNLYEGIKTEQELVELMLEEPDWDMLRDKTIVDQLFHINGHFDIVSKLEPKNIEQLASVLAIIRPAKRHLMHKYWSEILKEVWLKPTDDSYFFKKSHAVAYAQAIVVQMNLIKRNTI